MLDMSNFTNSAIKQIKKNRHFEAPFFVLFLFFVCLLVLSVSITFTLPIESHTMSISRSLFSIPDSRGAASHN